MERYRLTVMRAVDTGRTIKDRKLRPPSVDRSGFRDEQSSLIGISERSVAVLPFDTLSDERRDTYFADGVQDEILSTLAKGSRFSLH